MVAEADTTDITEATLVASRALLAVVARSLATTLEEITLPQWRVLVLLSSRGAMRSGALAELLGVHPSTFSRTADRMVAAGLISRAGNPDSRREVLIELAPAGRRLVDEVTSRRRAEIEAILARLPMRQRAVVLRGMSAFAAAAGEPAPADLATLGA
jgi:DNA-binding MarR family transcriptional regulator